MTFFYFLEELSEALDALVELKTYLLRFIKCTGDATIIVLVNVIFSLK
jgi:hypothetical protein